MNKYIAIIENIELDSIVEGIFPKEINMNFDATNIEEIKGEAQKLKTLFYVISKRMLNLSTSCEEKP